MQVAYAIGKARPVGMFVDTFGTGRVPDAQIQEAIARADHVMTYSAFTAGEIREHYGVVEIPTTRRSVLPPRPPEAAHR